MHGCTVTVPLFHQRYYHRVYTNERTYLPLRHRFDPECAAVRCVQVLSVMETVLAVGATEMLSRRSGHLSFSVSVALMTELDLHIAVAEMLPIMYGYPDP